MNEQNVQLSQMMEISNHGHVLYVYEKIDRYVKNAVSYIKMGIGLGNHVLIIENKDQYKLIYQRLQELLSHYELTRVHFVDNFDFYRLYGDFNVESIVNHFENLLRQVHDKRLIIRTWAHVEWKEQHDIPLKIRNFENKADERVRSAGMISVCAYNGNQISAALQTQLLKNHDYFMTDYQLVKSPLYRKRNVILHSLSEQKHMEGQLKASRHQLKSFIMHNFDPILIYNMEEKIVAVNQAFENTFGYSAKDVLGVSAEDFSFVPKDRTFEVARNRSFVFLGQYIEGYESVRLTKDGNTLNVMISCLPLWEEEGKVNGWALIFQDITEKKQAQEILINAEKLSIAGELAASIAHEIRNPVTTIKGFLQLLTAGDVEKADFYYNVMRSEIDRIELILSELLMLAKPQVNHFQQKNIALLLKDTIALLIPQANMNNVIIKTDLDSDEILVNCEGNQIKQVFINLIKNAIDSMPKGGNLLIQMESIGKEDLHIRFIDQGHGIPDHILSKLGQPFYTTKEKGTGLGFMVSKKIIENHQGTVSVFSKEHKGTTIDVNIPF